MVRKQHALNYTFHSSLFCGFQFIKCKRNSLRSPLRSCLYQPFHTSFQQGFIGMLGPKTNIFPIFCPDKKRKIVVCILKFCSDCRNLSNHLNSFDSSNSEIELNIVYYTQLQELYTYSTIIVWLENRIYSITIELIVKGCKIRPFL